MVIEIGFFAGEKLVHHGGPRGTRVAGERRAERDHPADPLGCELGDLARVYAAKTPTDQADLALVMVEDLLEPFVHQFRQIVAHSKVEPEAPRIGLVAESAQEPAEKARRPIGRTEAGKDKDRVAISSRHEPVQRPKGQPTRCRIPQMPVLPGQAAVVTEASIRSGR